MLSRHLGKEGNIACNLSPEDMAKVVTKTEGYSGSDMRALIQEACQVQIRCSQSVAVMPIVMAKQMGGRLWRHAG